MPFGKFDVVENGRVPTDRGSAYFAWVICNQSYLNSGIFFRESLVAPLRTAWSGYHLLFVVGVAGAAAGRFAGAFSPEPVVAVGGGLVAVGGGRTGSSTNLSLFISNLMSCVPMPRKPPTPITTPSTFPDLSRRISLISPSFSF